MNKYIRVLFNREHLFYALAYRGFWKFLNDYTFLKFAYKFLMGKPLNLDNPQTYSEKLQWLKLYHRDPLQTLLVDKYLVKDYVAKIIGEKYIIPTLGVYNSFDEIDFSSLPEQFVLKTNHNSGGIVICRDKKSFNKERARKILTLALKHNFYYALREWPYKNVKPLIIAEKYMEDSATEELRDYKFFCFNGQSKALFIASERNNDQEETKFDFYDMAFNHLAITNGHPNSKVRIEKPRCFDEMKMLAEKLSIGHPHVRVDFYEVNGKVYFGEMTFYHWSGLVPFNPEKWDLEFGNWIKLPKFK